MVALDSAEAEAGDPVRGSLLLPGVSSVRCWTRASGGTLAPGPMPSQMLPEQAAAPFSGRCRKCPAPSSAPACRHAVCADLQGWPAQERAQHAGKAGAAVCPFILSVLCSQSKAVLPEAVWGLGSLVHSAQRPPQPLLPGPVCPPAESRLHCRPSSLSVLFACAPAQILCAAKFLAPAGFPPAPQEVIGRIVACSAEKKDDFLRPGDEIEEPKKK